MTTTVAVGDSRTPPTPPPPPPPSAPVRTLSSTSRASSGFLMTGVEVAQNELRLDVPGVLDEKLLLGSVEHANDEPLLKHLHVGFVLDAENPRKRRQQQDDVSKETLGHMTPRRDRIDLDDDYTYESFRTSVLRASELLGEARARGDIAFVYCTHGNNESAVVCMAHLVVGERWTLERAYKHVQQRRPSTAPRRAYIEKLRTLERETHGHVTLRSAQVGPSMMDLMLGLRGEPARNDDADETASQVTEPESVESTVERASIMSNFSVATGLHNGSSLRETMVITEREDESEASSTITKHPRRPVTSAPGSTSLTGHSRTRNGRKDCVIS